MEDETKPLIVQSDGTIFLEVDKDLDHMCRDLLSGFCELIKSPEHVHTYKITPLAIWNAASSMISLEGILGSIRQYSRYEMPQNVVSNITDWYSRYGKLRLQKDPENNHSEVILGTIPDSIYLVSDDISLMQELLSRKSIVPYITKQISPNSFQVRSIYRGRLKQSLIKVGYPVEDRVGYLRGDPLDFSLREITLEGKPFSLRHYQKEAIESFLNASGSSMSGII
ncbi:DNA repair helicase, partial [mine drainage metagenome]